MKLTELIGVQQKQSSLTDGMRTTPLDSYEHPDKHDPIERHLAELRRMQTGSLAVVLKHDGKPLFGAESLILRDEKVPDSLVKVHRYSTGPESLAVRQQRVQRIGAYFGASDKCYLPKQQWSYHPLEGVQPEEKGFLRCDQEFVPEVADGETVDLRSRYLEDRMGDDFLGYYTDVQKRFTPSLEDRHPAASVDLFHEDESMFHLIAAAQRVPELHECLVDFTKRAIAFCSDTGEALDMGGEHNITLMMRNKAFAVVMLDPMYPMEGFLHTTQRMLRFYHTHDRLGKDGARSIRVGLQCVRNLNALAEALDLPERIHIDHIGPHQDEVLTHQLRSMPWSLLGQRIQAVYA